MVTRGPLHRLVRLDCALFSAVARAHTPWLDRWLPLLSRSANHSRLWIATATLLAVAGGRSGKRAAARGLGSIAVTSLLVSQGIKRLVRRPRPSLRSVPLVRHLPAQPLTTSFPSGHAASAAAFATGVAIEKPRAAPPIALAAAAVACSRVYVGVHYPFDAATGVAAGAAVALGSRQQWAAAPERVQPGGERVTLPASADGAGVAVVVNRESGFRVRGNGLRRGLPAARVVDVEHPERLPEELIRAAPGCEVLGVCGGDGSAAAAAEAAVEGRRPLLLLSGGTLNHLARDLAIESQDEALAALRAGTGRRVDVAVVDGRPFVNTVGFGAYPAMLDARAPLEKPIGRWPAQLTALALTLVRARPLEVDVDGRRRRVWMGVVGNCRHEPKGFAPSRRPRLDDGLFDVRLLLAERRLSRLRLLGGLLGGRLERSKAYERFEAPRLELRADGPLRLAADGDPLDAGSSATLTKAGRLAVYAP